MKIGKHTLNLTGISKVAEYVWHRTCSWGSCTFSYDSIFSICSRSSQSSLPDSLEKKKKKTTNKQTNKQETRALNFQPDIIMKKADEPHPSLYLKNVYKEITNQAYNYLTSSVTKILIVSYITLSLKRIYITETSFKLQIKFRNFLLNLKYMLYVKVFGFSTSH